jgi:hypothetical protein
MADDFVERLAAKVQKLAASAIPAPGNVVLGSMSRT